MYFCNLFFFNMQPSMDLKVDVSKTKVIWFDQKNAVKNASEMETSPEQVDQLDTLVKDGEMDWKFWKLRNPGKSRHVNLTLEDMKDQVGADNPAENVSMFSLKADTSLIAWNQLINDLLQGTNVCVKRKNGCIS